MKNEIKTLYVTEGEEWRKWLSDNHHREKEVWLLYYKRHTCKPRIPYDTAVEEAICFGWIDSIIRRIDDNTYCQKFTPRRKKSRWSELNIKRAKKMIESGRMTEYGMKSFEEVKKDPSLIVRSPAKTGKKVIPDDLSRALRIKEDSYRKFMDFAESYRQMCIRWIDAAKKKETRAARINEVVEKASVGEKIGLK